MERLLAVLNVFSRIALIFGLMLLLPIGVSWWIGDGVLTAFDEAFFGTMATGGFLLLATQRFRRELRANDGVLLVVMCWTLLPLIAALPLLLGIPGLGFADAYFEAVSGLTATGATVLSGLDKLPPSLNLWRTELHWIGGLGIIVLAVAILPMLGVGGRQLMKAEVPGPVKEAGITPRVTETAKGFWVILHRLTAVCRAGLRLQWHELAGCAHPCLQHGFSRRLFQPRRQLRLLRFTGAGGDHHWFLR